MIKHVKGARPKNSKNVHQCRDKDKGAHRKFPKCLVVPGHFGFEPVWVIGVEEAKIAARPLLAALSASTGGRCLAAGGR